MPRTYTLFLTGSAAQADELKTSEAGVTIKCTDNCGPDNYPPVVAESTTLLPAVKGSFASFSSLSHALARLGAAADSALAVEVTGFDPGHAVVVLHWVATGNPIAPRCVDCPPDTLPSRYPPQIGPAVQQRVLGFDSAELADAWVASPEGQAFLRNAVYQRMFIPA